MNQSISKEKLLLYRVSYNELYRVLKTAFRENSVTMLHSYQQYLPDKIKNKKYYEFGSNKNEQAFKSYWDKVKNKK